MKNIERVYQWLAEHTRQLDGQHVEGFTAQDVAASLEMKRNLASHLLNRLVEDDRAVKSTGRPVYYLSLPYFNEHKEQFSAFPEQEGDSDSIDVSKEDLDRVFDSVIGSRGSLRYIVDQCKSAVLYPPLGLPILLSGETGVGKSLLAQAVHKYAKAAGVLGDSAPFLVFNCAEYAHNAELLSATLFGYCKGAFTGADSDRIGLIEQADGGILFLDEVHRLSPESQEKLFVFLDKGKFRRLGESGAWRSASVRLVYATTASPENHFLKTFLRRIPLIVQVPAYHERPQEERMELIQHLYNEESQTLKRDIHVSGQVINLLVSVPLEGNVGKVINSIKLSCASALSESFTMEGALTVQLHHLPREYQSALSHILTEDASFPSYQFSVSEERCTVKRSGPEGAIETFLCKNASVAKRWLSDPKEKEALRALQKGIAELIDHFIYETDAYRENKLLYKTIEQLCAYMLQELQQNKGISVHGNSIDVVASLYYFTWSYTVTEEHRWVTSVLEELEQQMDRTSRLVEGMNMLLHKNLDVSVAPITRLGLMLYMSSLDRRDTNGLPQAILIAHGHATASSIAGVVNRILGQYVFDAIDMPFDLSTEEIAKRLCGFLDQKTSMDGVLILVDMGSLETIYTEIQERCLGELAIMNNLTMGLALEVGGRLVNREPLETIVKQSAGITTHSYSYMPAKRSKQPAILVTCNTGIGTAMKISDLLSECLQAQDIAVMAYDLQQLRGNGVDNAVFKQYDVKLILGTDHPRIETIPFVYIEDLIMQQETDSFKPLLHETLGVEAVDTLQREITRQFTLENIINYLTILNPDRILEQVEQALDNLERGLGVHLHNTHRISLTIHTCCMIERLVMKDPIIGKYDTEAFVREHKEFVKRVQNAFKPLERYYNVEIPIAEMGYIRDHLQDRMTYFSQL